MAVFIDPLINRAAGGLDAACFQLPEADLAQLRAYFQTPFEWPFRDWRVEGAEVPPELQGAGVRVLANGTENGPLETLLIVHEEKNDAAPVVERLLRCHRASSRFM